MNHCVPDFEIEDADDYSMPSSSGFPPRPKKPSLVEDDEIMELLWHNGGIVTHPQNHRPSSSLKKSPPPISSSRPTEESPSQLFMQEDEMLSWLHCPIDSPSTAAFGRDLCADLIYQPAAAQSPPPPPVAPRPPIPPRRRSSIQRFGHFSRFSGSAGPSDSSETPPHLESTISTTMDAEASAPKGSSSSGDDGGRLSMAVAVTVTSFPVASACAAESGNPLRNAPEAEAAAATEKCKRRSREAEDEECSHSEKDSELESTDTRKEGRASTSAKRTRAAEVHNLSERRRRDRINEKMRALQELIPRCNKSDKASMLDEAIEYLKSLQMQVQMMSMGCSMVPMMFPNVQPYMSPMGMGMGMTRPVMPFPSAFTGPTPVPAAAAHLGPRFPIPGFHVPSVPIHDPSSKRTSNQTGHLLNSVSTQNLKTHQTSNLVDPYQQFIGLHQVQLPYHQNQQIVQPSAGMPSTDKETENPGNHQPG